MTTDVDITSEFNQSGTIVNPNDELAVTYLFYELQKRYRLSEQLYRVMPVVMVAQEVPSPDQITPAWISVPRLDPQSSSTRRQLPAYIEISSQQ